MNSEHEEATTVAKLTPEVQAVIGRDLWEQISEPNPWPVGDDLFMQIKESGFLGRFWHHFGGNPVQWGGLPNGPELGLAVNHFDRRLEYANCSFDPNCDHDPTGKKFMVSCSFVASVVRHNITNVDMWKTMTTCLNGKDFALVMGIINHRFHRHFN